MDAADGVNWMGALAPQDYARRRNHLWQGDGRGFESRVLAIRSYAVERDSEPRTLLDLRFEHNVEGCLGNPAQ